MSTGLPSSTPLPAASDPAFERFSRLVRAQLGVPVALVTLVSEEEQVFPGSLGLPEPWQTERRTPLSHSFCQHVVRSEQTLVITDAREHPLVRDNLAIRDLGVVAYAGVPLRDHEGAVVGSLCAIDSEPHEWTATDLAVLTDLADACSSELQLRGLHDRTQTMLVQHAADRARWSLAMDAGHIGSFDWHLATDELTWDDRLLEIFGLTRATFGGTIAAFDEAVVPEDAERVAHAIDKAITTAGLYEAEYRITLPGGGTRWVQARGQALADGTGRAERLIGVAYDTTAVHDGEARTARVLEAMPTGYLSVDHDWRFTVVNGAAERLLGRSRDELLGNSIHDVFPGTRDGEFGRAYLAAVETRVPQTVEAFYPDPLNAWYEVLCWPSPDGLSLFFTDTTQRTLTQRRAEASAARLAMLATVARSLVDATDVPDAVAELPGLVVPGLADGCIVTLLQDDGRPRDVGSWHTDPAQRSLLHRYARVRLGAQSLTSPLARALASGEEVRASAAEVRATLAAGEALDLYDALGTGSCLVLPIRGRDRVRGALTLFSDPGRPRDLDDESTARDVADRVGLALDNAALLMGQSQVAEGLQRSLLTDPPAPNHSEIVVRYIPATESAKVGGDWYDAFLQPSGSTMLVIGDVVGHDIEAAAAMGQLRGLLRGIAAYSDAGPAEVLRGLDAAMQVLQVPTLATAAVARFEQTPEEYARGVTRLLWSNAGHLPPVIVHPDGSLAVLAEWRGNLLLGVDPTTTRTEQVITLDRGSTILLFTDGLVERRASTLDDDMARLSEAVVDLAGGTLEQLCDGLITRLVDGRNDDDIALVAVRLHPQDKPRPPEAGPVSVPPGLPADVGARLGRG
ncbi:PAS domain S-box-containing protein [Klenkia marina]|uniref:PAS domain S-box-containing protein n=1 Tax=Klenkia marina TaxID=1960309 RepID=A0A1G4XRA0_9ACTN|nr:SpoIIE family protein phosphatase [Klenkia marina]SCX43625.1 PAS domain S-box-containing protein [Klenkia marina]